MTMAMAMAMAMAMTMTMTPPLTSKPTKKSVHFDTRVAVYSVQHVNDMSEHMKSEVWYSQWDLKRIRFEFVEMGRTMLSHGGSTDNDELDPEEFCLRGLEFRINREVCEQRKQTKRNAMMVVMKEQERQRSCGGHQDNLLMASLYKLESKVCSADALELGRLDEEAAREVQMQMQMQIQIQMEECQQGQQEKQQLVREASNNNSDDWVASKVVKEIVQRSSFFRFSRLLLLKRANSGRCLSQMA